MAQSKKQSALKIKHPRRRGIVLLVIISILVLFMLMLVTFAVVSSHYRQAAQSNASRNYYRDDPHQEMDHVFQQLLVGPAHPYSSNFGQDLLGDLYGNDGLLGQVSALDNVNNGQNLNPFLGLQFWPVTSNTTTYNPPGLNPQNLGPTLPFGVSASKIDGYYSGSVVTFIDGPCKGLSSRIVHYVTNLSANAVTPPGLRMEPFTSDDGSQPVPNVGDSFLINGKPFNGTGLGKSSTKVYANDDILYDNAGNPLSDATGNFPVALMPHLAQWGNITAAVNAVRGGNDEPWDTFDYQNMFLALVPANNRTQIIPSFHRPDLLNYWINRYSAAALPLSDPSMNDLRRKILFRPLPYDHYDFTGSNPNLTPQWTNGPDNQPRTNDDVLSNANTMLLGLANIDANTGAYNPNLNFFDVDNDGDGRMDSIWYDPGLPAVHAENGRTYKRLVAVMIRDLDGRVNVNAHGSAAYIAQKYRADMQVSGLPLPSNSPSAVYLPRGLGYGPAEINFMNLFYDGTQAVTQPLPPAPPITDNALLNAQNVYKNLLLGSGNIVGRYGIDADTNLNDLTKRRPGIYGPLQPSVVNTPTLANPAGNLITNDALSAIKLEGYPTNYSITDRTQLEGQVGIYGSPPDVWGRGAITLDLAGFPYPVQMAAKTDWQGDSPANVNDDTDEVIDNPYELNLVETSANDSPYTVAELEKVLRQFDHDANNLPTRLFDALSLSGNTDANGTYNGTNRSQNGNTRPGSLRAHMVSTISSHIPAPRGMVPKYMRLVAGGTPLPPDKSYALPVLNNGVYTQPANTSPTPDGVSILDAAAARVIHDTLTANPPLTPTQISDVVEAIMPFELFRGEMFNLNRPFGNGVDDNGNGVVDEPGEEVLVNANAWNEGPFANAATAVTPSNDDIIYNKYGTAYKDPRQLYARHLYCLARLVCDPLYNGTYTQTTPNLATPSGDKADRDRLYARRLAQWAVNVVDYRDSDAIMTPFEYDVKPFNGWMVDGDLATDENATPPNGANLNGLSTQAGERGVVWGMEQPDLLITETLAFHNTRLKDTNLETGPTQSYREDNAKPGFLVDPTPDADLDQYGIPQGSLFFELKSARPFSIADANYSVSNPRYPAELYVPNVVGGVTRIALNISQLAPARQADNIVQPVWRVVVTENKNPPNSPLDEAKNSSQDTMNFDPNNWDLIGNGTQVPDRIIWFTPSNPALNNNPDINNVFYQANVNNNPAQPTYLQSGEYLVIGPRADTAISSLKNDPDNDPNLFNANQNRIQLPNSNSFTTSGSVGFTYPPNAYSVPQPLVKNAVGMVCAADPPKNDPAWAGIKRTIGVNISEPLPNGATAYYPPPVVGDYYANLKNAFNAANNFVYDHPFDSPDPAGVVKYPGPLTKDPLNRGRTTATRPDFRSMFLQRLANPTIAWNPEPNDPVYGAKCDKTKPVNPYITVDWASIDLTVYNGEENPSTQLKDKNGNPAGDKDPQDPTPYAQNLKFASRERGLVTDNPATSQLTVQLQHPVNNVYLYDSFLWHTRSTSPPTTQHTGATHYFEQKLANPRDPANTSDFWHTLGFLNFSMGKPTTTLPVANSVYTGSPSRPFPLLSWNNRPFANPYELLTVPTSSSSRFGWEFQYYDPLTSKYEDKISGNFTSAYDVTKPENKRGYFNFLMNLFSGNNFPNTGQDAATPDPTNAPSHDLARLFDFVETPSPFVGTERWYHPTTTANGVWGEKYRPPFNRLSRFRDPGRININTITEPEVWDALVATNPELSRYTGNMNGTPPLPPGVDGTANGGGWYKLVDSRRTFPGNPSNANGNLFTSINNSPTLFPNPFRPADAFDLMPLGNLKLQRPVDATLLRADPNSPNVPLLDRPHNQVGAAGQPNDDYRNSDRNAFFKYQPFCKLPNLVSTNSNTFAVWITIGYFEATPGPIDAGHPDGFRLGQELGLDDGTARRHRGFYILDRSIPVGYEPGKMHNADRCVLLKRFIE